MQNPLLDPRTGDYVLDSKGKPIETNSLQIPAYIRLKAKRKTWQYAPDEDWGSDFYLIKKRRTDQNPTLLESIGAAAIQPIVDDGRAIEAAVFTVHTARHGVGLQADILDAQGKQVESIVFPAIF